MGPILRWISRNPVVAITLVGTMLFGIARLAYAVFYAKFDVTPEEVGIGYQETLAQSALMLVVTILLVAFVFLAISTVAWLWWGFLDLVSEALERLVSKAVPSLEAGRSGSNRLLWKAMSKRAGSRGVRRLFYTSIMRLLMADAPRIVTRERVTSPLWRVRILGAASILSIAFTILLLLSDAGSAGDAARRGASVGPNTMFGIPLLLRRAEAASVYPTTSSTTVADMGLKTDCNLYLGRSGGTKIFYEYDPATRSGRIVRLPDAAVSVVVPARGSSCP